MNPLALGEVFIWKELFDLKDTVMANPDEDAGALDLRDTVMATPYEDGITLD